MTPACYYRIVLGAPITGRRHAAGPRPTVGSALLPQATGLLTHDMAGEHGDEPVRRDAILADVPDRPQADIHLQAAEDGLDSGKLPIRGTGSLSRSAYRVDSR